MTVEALVKGHRILEVPISYNPRQGSKTKIDPWGDGIRMGNTLPIVLMNVLC
jgi:hypothetical protein